MAVHCPITTLKKSSLFTLFSVTQILSRRWRNILAEGLNVCFCVQYFTHTPYLLINAFKRTPSNYVRNIHIKWLRLLETDTISSVPCSSSPNSSWLPQTCEGFLTWKFYTSFDNLSCLARLVLLKESAPSKSPFRPWGHGGRNTFPALSPRAPRCFSGRNSTSHPLLRHVPHRSNFSLPSNQFTGQVYFIEACEREKRGIKDIAIGRVELPYEMSWSLRTSTSIQMPAFFGVKRSLWTMVLGVMLAHGPTLLPVRRNTTKGNTIYMQVMIRRVPLLLVTRQVFLEH